MRQWNDALQVTLVDQELLTETRLMGELIVAASESDGPSLTLTEVDRVLGIRCQSRSRNC
jgi:hypothetical protein